MRLLKIPAKVQYELCTDENVLRLLKIRTKLFCKIEKNRNKIKQTTVTYFSVINYNLMTGNSA